MPYQYNPYQTALEKFLYSGMTGGSPLGTQVNPQPPMVNNPGYKDVAPLLGEFSLLGKKADNALPYTSPLEAQARSAGPGLLGPQPDTPSAPAQTGQQSLPWWVVALQVAGAQNPGLLSLLGGQQKIPMAPARLAGGASALPGIKQPEPSMYSLLGGGRR